MDPDVYEKLGAFFLGGRYDVAKGEATGEPLLYDAKDLVTHAVCVGMTGSGKTGLCVTLLEEAAIDGVPALVIDPSACLASTPIRFKAASTSCCRSSLTEPGTRGAISIWGC